MHRIHADANQRDALQALAACAQNYGPNTIDTYAVTLWDAVKFEILSSQEEDLADEALTVLFGVTRTLSASPHDGPLQTYLRPVAKECNEHLEDTPTKQSSASSKILSTTAKSSTQASDCLLKTTLPQISALYKSAESLPRRRGLLETLVALIQSNLELFGHWRKIIALKAEVSAAPPPSLKETSNSLCEYSDHCISVLNAAFTLSPIEEVSFRLLALDGLRSLAVIRGLLDETTITSIVKSLLDVVMKEKPYGRDEVKASCIDALVLLAHQKPQLMIETALPNLMVELPDTDAHGPDKSYMLALESLAKLSAEQQIFNTIIIRLKNKLYTGLRLNASSTYILCILQTLLYSFIHGAVDLQSATVFGAYYQDLVIPLLKDIVAAKDASLIGDAASHDSRVLDALGRICNVIIRSQPWVSQLEISRNVYTIFREIDLETLPPFVDTKSDDKLSRTMSVSTHLLGALHRQAKPFGDVESLFSALVRYALNTSNPALARQAAINQLTLVTNKYLRLGDARPILSPLFDSTSSSSLTYSQSTTTASLQTAFSIVKALLLRTDPFVSEILPEIIVTFKLPEHGHSCAQAFAALLSETQLDTLSKENHCLIYGLRKQRFFAASMPLLIEAYRSAPVSEEELRRNYLTAIVGTLQHVPYSLTQSSLIQLTPLLLQTLSSFSSSSDPADQVIMATALSLFSNIIVHDSKLIETHASSLIARLLDVTAPITPPSAPGTTPNQEKLRERIEATSSSTETAARVRSAALTCLTAFVSESGTITQDGGVSSTVIKRELLIPHQREVVRRLSIGACDDTRRAVRSEAVRCRSVWLALEGGDED